MRPDAGGSGPPWGCGGQRAGVRVLGESLVRFGVNLLWGVVEQGVVGAGFFVVLWTPLGVCELRDLLE